MNIELPPMKSRLVNNLADCCSCRYWKPDSSTDMFGECRRLAPKPKLSDSDLGMIAYWPPTSDSDGCGEHVPLWTETGLLEVFAYLQVQGAFTEAAGVQETAIAKALGLSDHETNVLCAELEARGATAPAGNGTVFIKLPAPDWAEADVLNAIIRMTADRESISVKQLEAALVLTPDGMDGEAFRRSLDLLAKRGITKPHAGRTAWSLAKLPDAPPAANSTAAPSGGDAR